MKGLGGGGLGPRVVRGSTVKNTHKERSTGISMSIANSPPRRYPGRSKGDLALTETPLPHRCAGRHTTCYMCQLPVRASPRGACLPHTPRRFLDELPRGASGTQTAALHRHLRRHRWCTLLSSGAPLRNWCPPPTTPSANQVFIAPPTRRSETAARLPTLRSSSLSR